MKNRPSLELILLLVAVFMTAIVGGQVGTEAMPGGGIFAALSGDASAVRMTRLVIGILVFGALILTWFKNRSVVLPKQKISAILLIFFLVLCLSISGSSFRSSSIDALLNWLLYFAAFLCTIGVTGRRFGPVLVMGAIVASSALVGLKGSIEYFQMHYKEPGYRIFAGWNNPNGLASLFSMTLPIAFGLSFNKHKAVTYIGMIGGVLIGSGLWLTQSKGGILAALIGVAVFIALAFSWKQKPLKIGLSVLPLIAGIVLAVGLQALPTEKASAGPGGRLTASGGESEQSVGFRKLLWQSQIDLIKQKPITGWGVGTFIHASAKPGLVTQTVYGHQNYLQLAAEAGVGALIAFLALGVFWIYHVFKGSKSMPEEVNILKAGVIAAICAAGAHGMIESSLSYVGIGLLFFVILGLGLQLASDGTIPELMPKSFRLVTILCAFVGPLFFMSMFARLEMAKSSARFALDSQTEQDRAAALAELGSFTGWDGEAAYFSALLSPPEQRLELIRQAADKSPSTRILRSLAKLEADSGNFTQADSAIALALNADPNNLFTLQAKMKLLIDQDRKDEAIAAARDLISAENSTPFKVRALPEFIPTATYSARLWLSDQVPAERIALLEPALEGYKSYLEKTVPVILDKIPSGDMVTSMGSESRTSAKKAMEEGEQVAKKLGDAYRASGRSSDAVKCDELAAKFLSASESLGA